ncbi:MAG: hypothetical protein ACKVT1_01380 [Dehalococcoidia bacterium]
MGKFALLGLACVLLLTARCYNADLEGALAGLPVVGAMISPPQPTPKYVETIGTPAPASFPETDIKTWFVPPEAGAEPYNIETWRAISSFAANAVTKGGWAEACKKATEAAGADRTATPLVGALACSSDGTVTALQRFGVQLLAMQAEVAFYLRGVPGSSLAAIQARQGELRLTCATDIIARLGPPEAALGGACTGALATAYLEADAPATFAALAEAYASLAAEVARRDPKTADQPSYFEPEPKK